MRISRNREAVRRANVCHAQVRFERLCALMVIVAALHSQPVWAQPTGLSLPVASYQDDTEYETIPPPEISTNADRKDLRSAIRSDPELAAVVREEAQMMLSS